MNHTEWLNCYPSNWKGIIVPDAMSHPAKYSSKLIRRIYEHMLEQGWVQAGDKVLDPFGGVALGALDAMRLGLHWTGNELESKFFDLGNQNIAKWNTQYCFMPNWGTARLLQGDSRHLLDVIGNSVQVSVSSPPYADSDQDYKGGWKRFHDGHTPLHNNIQREAQYGTTDGQLSAMPANQFDAAISSPPFERTETGGELPRDKYPQVGGDVMGYRKEHQGCSEGQLGNDSGNDFWLAARAIVEQVFTALQPGGHAVWVVKDYVKNKQIVPFSHQWQQLCESVGFQTLHEHHAMLVHHKGTQHTLDGGTVERKTESKSFFRRLAEKKGSPRIDYETVFCMVKDTQYVSNAQDSTQ